MNNLTEQLNPYDREEAKYLRRVLDEAITSSIDSQIGRDEKGREAALANAERLAREIVLALTGKQCKLE